MFSHKRHRGNQGTPDNNLSRLDTAVLGLFLGIALMIMSANDPPEHTIYQNGSQLILQFEQRAWEFTIVDARKQIIEPFQMLGHVPEEVNDVLRQEGFTLQ